MPERTDVYRNYSYMLELGQGEKAAYFTEVTKSRTVIRNVPPAHVYRCRR